MEFKIHCKSNYSNELKRKQLDVCRGKTPASPTNPSTELSHRSCQWGLEVLGNVALAGICGGRTGPSMSRKKKNSPKRLQWRLECLGHTLLEVLAGLLPGPWVFRLGEALGGWVWPFMPRRRAMILRNLRIAFAGEKDPTEIRRMVKATFRRTGGNLISAAHTARLAPEQLGRVIRIENLELLEQALAGGKGVVLLLAHMGNWEILSRLIHLFPPGSRAGAFYRPLNNPLLDARVLARRQADGTRMFSKSDNPLRVAGFLREGGIVGILADQRVGAQGDGVRFFGRFTHASPLPSLLARRAKSAVLALSVTSAEPGTWRAVFMPVEAPPTTAHCMAALERAMQAGPIDVFWFQERWKVKVPRRGTVRDWLGAETTGGGGKPLRGLLWLVDAPAAWHLPESWFHPEVVYEIVLAPGGMCPSWLPATTTTHHAPLPVSRTAPAKTLAVIDADAALPLDFVLVPGASAALVSAGQQLVIPVISLPSGVPPVHPDPSQAAFRRP